MTHVVVIPSWYPSFAGDPGGSFFREQAIAVARRGCKVGVIYPELRSLRKWRALLNAPSGYSRSEDSGVPTYRWRGTNWFPRIPLGNRYLWIKHGTELFRRYVRDHGTPEVLHAHSILNAGVLAAEISRLFEIPFLITEHSSAFALNRLGAGDLRVSRSVVGGAAALLSVSEHLGKHLKAALDTQAEWKTVSNMVANQFLAHPLSDRPHSSTFTFINVAFANENKRQADIIRAFASVFPANTDCLLKICGGGPEWGSLKALAASLGIAARVKFTGQLSRTEVLTEMADADAFVLASAYETFGVALIEALALGKPVISTQCGGPESIVTPADGLLVPVANLSRLGQAMQHVYERRGHYQPSAIRARCERRFGEAAISDQLREIYDSTAARSSVPVLEEAT